VPRATRTPLRTWFWAYIVATHHPAISVKQLQHQLGLSRYETAWLILHKLRRAMVAPEREPLENQLEVHEFFLGGQQGGPQGAAPSGATSRRRRRGLGHELRAPAPAGATRSLERVARGV
jgi:hypothetical protein